MQVILHGYYLYIGNSPSNSGALALGVGTAVNPLGLVVVSGYCFRKTPEFGAVASLGSSIEAPFVVVVQL